jgi:hypothetical protein
VREAKLVEERACVLHPSDGWDLPSKLEELCKRMVRVKEESTAEAERLVVLVIEASKALVDLELPHIQDVPQILSVTEPPQK